METFKAILKQKGLKATSQRELMLKSIEESGHIDIDALKEKMQLSLPNVSLNTIYLNLEQLAKEEVIVKVALNNQKSVYEIKKHMHAHLVCEACGRIEDIDVDDQILTATKEGACQKTFVPSFVAINIYGICRVCASNPTKKETQ